MAKKILIIEDEKPLSKALQLKLQGSEFEVDFAFNGQDGLDKLKAQSYDLVLLDLVMPVLDGFSVLENIKKEKISSSVIVLSNLGQESDREKVEKLGAKGFFVKSNTPISDLVDHVNELLK